MLFFENQITARLTKKHTKKETTKYFNKQNLY